MACLKKLFKSNKYDLPIITSVQGMVKLSPGEIEFLPNNRHSSVTRGNIGNGSITLQNKPNNQIYTQSESPVRDNIIKDNKLQRQPTDSNFNQRDKLQNRDHDDKTIPISNVTSIIDKIATPLSDKVRRHNKIKQCVKVESSAISDNDSSDKNEINVQADIHRLHHKKTESVNTNDKKRENIPKSEALLAPKSDNDELRKAPKTPRAARKRTAPNRNDIETTAKSVPPQTPKVEVGECSKELKNEETTEPRKEKIESTPSKAYDEDTTGRSKSDSGIVSDEDSKIELPSKADDYEELGNIIKSTSDERKKKSNPPLPGVLDDAKSSIVSKRQTEELASSVLNPPIKNDRRKEGIISDRIEQKPNKDFKIDFFEKDSETEELIRKAILANDFLNNMMDGERLIYVIKAMLPERLDANSFLIREGDVGSHFYVSAEGEFEVIKDGEVRKKFGAGVVFGELAILYKANRFASIKVTTEAKVWVLERRVFQRIMMKFGNQEREQNIKFLDSVSIFQGLSRDVLLKISDLLKREFYATGTTIIRQGDPGDKFYIIRGGSVSVSKRMNGGETRIVGILKRGQYFGEQALINQDKRLANVIANEPGTECLTLNRVAFTNYLGTIEELKKKPVDQIPLDETELFLQKKNIINIKYDHIQLEDLNIIGTLGVGAFGRVELVQYKANETFALKILKKYEVVHQGQIEHAYSEKDIMAICDSDFIVKLYKTYRNKKYLYFLMEPCLGGDVWTQLQKSRYFDDKTANFVTGCVVEAFEYLHSRNIIYRDLKPENLMFDANSYVKLGDFGYAKRIQPNSKTWTFAGTPEYVAPEVILNKGYDRAVDYWALGVFVHELLVGKPPFRGKDHMKTYNLILRGIDVVQMPSKISKSAQNLIRVLCRQVSTERLGYQRKGIGDIKKHAWFDGFDWIKLEKRTLQPPIKCIVRNNTDLSNFEECTRDRDDPPDETSGWDINF